ncbi:MAG: GIY-YIG nuclease family protein [Devosia sp.]
MNDSSMNNAHKAPGRTVRLFLADGQPQGIVIADVGNWSGKALAAPRGRLPDLLRRTEASRTGVYILLGPNPDQIDGVLAYIGEADDIAARMRIHLRSESKDFFNRVVFLVSSDEMLTKGHVRYLESRLIKLAQDAGRSSLPTTPILTSSDFPKPTVRTWTRLWTMPPWCCQSWAATCFGVGNGHRRPHRPIESPVTRLAAQSSRSPREAAQPPAKRPTWAL